MLKDVCDVLGLENPTLAKNRLDGDDLSTTYAIDRLGRSQGVTTVNESGLYDVIFQSRTADPFGPTRASIPDAWPSRKQRGFAAG